VNAYDKFNGNNSVNEQNFQPLVPASVGQPDNEDEASLEGSRKEATELFKALYKESKKSKDVDEFSPFYTSENAESGNFGQDDDEEHFKPLYSSKSDSETMPKKPPDKALSDEVSDKSSDTSQDISAETSLEDAGNIESETSDASEEHLKNASAMKVAEQAAWKEGFLKGEKDGFDKGHKEGVDKGFEEGVARGKEEGIKEGLKEGTDAGYAEGVGKAEAQTAYLHQIITELDTLWVNMVKKHEVQIIDLISKIAGKVVSGAVKVDNDIVKRAILHAFEVMPETVDVSISVNPEDYEYIEMIKEDFFAAFKELQSISVNATPAVNRGGCKVESKVGQINSSIEERLANIFLLIWIGILILML